MSHTLPNAAMLLTGLTTSLNSTIEKAKQQSMGGSAQFIIPCTREVFNDSGELLGHVVGHYYVTNWYQPGHVGRYENGERTQ